MIIATQSAKLVDYFEPEEIILGERPEDKTLFTRRSDKEVGDWLDEYPMSELWKKNVPGRP